MELIKIEGQRKHKCPNCSFIFAIENDFEILYKNIMLLYFNREQGLSKIKCRQCKYMINVKVETNKIIVIE